MLVSPSSLKIILNRGKKSNRKQRLSVAAFCFDPPHAPPAALMLIVSIGVI
jgi:hypothetical protein